MARPSYMDFLNAFNMRLSFEYYTSNEQLFYHTLLMMNNACFWVEWFSRTDEQLTSFMKIGISAMKTARNSLKQRGAIDFKTSKVRGTCTQYKICDDFLYISNHTTNVYQMNDKRLSDELQMNNNSISTLTPYKTKNKTKNKTNISFNKSEGKAEKFSAEKIINDFTNDDELRAALIDFVKMRKDIKKPITTERALNGALKKLMTLSDNVAEQIELVNIAVERNWLTFYKTDTKSSTISTSSGGRALTPVQQMQEETLEFLLNNEEELL